MTQQAQQLLLNNARIACLCWIVQLSPWPLIVNSVACGYICDSQCEQNRTNVSHCLRSITFLHVMRTWIWMGNKITTRMQVISLVSPKCIIEHVASLPDLHIWAFARTKGGGVSIRDVYHELDLHIKIFSVLGIS